MVDPRVELLQGLDADAVGLVRRLDQTAIHIRVGPQASVLALSLVNTLARLFPSITTEAPPGEVSILPFGQGVAEELLARTVARARASSGVRSPEVALVVDVGCNTGGADLYVNSDGWTLTIATGPMQDLAGGGPANVAASALAAAEIMRCALPELPGVRLQGSFTWNLVDYRLTSRGPIDMTSARIDATCFGAGSVGSSLLYSLLLSNARGNLAFVDADRLSLRNRLRYPLLLEPSSMSKASWVESIAAGSPLHVVGHAETAERYINALQQPMRFAVSAVDSISARRDIVDALAQTVLNAGVDGMKLHISRHGFDDGLACLYCPYVDAGDALDEAGMYQQMTGLPSERVLELLSGQALEEADIQFLRTNGRIEPSSLGEELIGGRLQDIGRARLYAQAAMKVADSNLTISAPFVSSLAGSILAAETIKEALGLELIDRRVDVDCSGYPTGFVTRPRQDETGRCLCHSALRVNEYTRLWGRKTSAPRPDD